MFANITLRLRMPRLWPLTRVRASPQHKHVGPIPIERSSTWPATGACTGPCTTLCTDTTLRALPREPHGLRCGRRRVGWRPRGPQGWGRYRRMGRRGRVGASVGAQLWAPHTPHAALSRATVIGHARKPDAASDLLNLAHDRRVASPVAAASPSQTSESKRTDSTTHTLASQMPVHGRRWHGESRRQFGIQM